MQEFSIATHLTYKEYFNMQFKFRYAKPWIRIITILAILHFIAYVIALKEYDYDMLDNSITAIGFFFLYFSIIFPILSLWIIRKSFKGNLRLQEPIIYHFSEKGIAYTGESFSGSFSWDKLYKIQIYKGWLLIYQSSLSYLLIKLSTDDDANMHSLKEFLQNQNDKRKLRMQW